MNVMGLVFANDASLGELTTKRTMASIPFGGRYRLVDFALSNLCCANVRHVGVVTRHSYMSLMNHIGSGEEWGLELEEGGLEFLTPYAASTSHAYRGKLESIYDALDFLAVGEEDEYVVMIDASVVSNVDIKDVVNHHIASGKSITVVTKAGVANGKKVQDLALKLDDKGEVVDVVVDYAADESYLTSVDIFVLSKKLLVTAVKDAIARNMYHMDRDLVLGGWRQGLLSLNVYPFKGVVLYNDSVEEYFASSMALLDKDIRHDIFGYNHTVYTKVRDRVPTYYGDSCAIENCLIADGCMLEGGCKDSILFRQVTVCNDAEVRNCLVMNDTVIGENAQLQYVIVDKDVTIRPGSKLIGTKNNPIIIKRGEVV